MSWKGINYFSLEFKIQITELITGKLIEEIKGTIWGTSDENEKAALAAAWKLQMIKRIMAEPTGLEPATSNVTGEKSQSQTRLIYQCFQPLGKT